MRQRIDRVLTHRVFGPVIFIAFMAVIFSRSSCGPHRS